MTSKRSDDQVDALLEQGAPPPSLAEKAAVQRIEGRLFDKPETPTQLGRYTILELVGRGGMGRVYAAYDPQLERKVALKVLHPGADADPNEPTMLRLLREAQAIAKVSHPNVVEVYDVGTLEPEQGSAPTVFVAMELIAGVDLAKWLRGRSRTWREIVGIFVQAGRGLIAAHAGGIVHRDFKPSNVLVGEDGRVRVLDFGLARAIGDTVDSAEGPPSADPSIDESAETRPAAPGLLNTALTQQGTVIGTPAYMAPEQHQGDVTDARTDQYAFCVALYEALYRRRPFNAKNVEALFREKCDGVADEPPSPNVPTWLHRAVVRGLAPHPDDRWPTMEPLLRILAPTRTGTRWLGGLVIVSGAAALFLGLQPSDGTRCSGADRLTGVWDASRAADVRTAFRATGLAYAGDSWQLAADWLDRYASEWSEAYQGVCEAGTKSTELLDLQMDCLNRRLAELDALAAVLTAADSDTVGRAVNAAVGLSPVDRCLDPEIVRAHSPLPADGHLATEVSTIRDELVRASALDHAGRYAEAESIAQAAVDRARALEYGPVLAEALLVMGAAQSGLGTFARAEDSLAEAFWVASAEKLDGIAGRSATKLVYTVGYGLGRIADGMAWVRHAEAVVERGGLSGTPLLAHAATLTARSGDFERAATLYEQVLSEHERELGPRHPSVATVLAHLAIMNHRRGRLAVAQTYHERAIATTEEVLGPMHPSLASKLTNLAITLARQGKTEQARRAHDRAVAVAERSVGRDHPILGQTLLNRGMFALRHNLLDLAHANVLRAVTTFERTLGPDHPDLGRASASLGILQDSEGDHAAALRSFQRALAGVEPAVGPDHPDVGIILMGLGQAELSSGAPERAVPILERGLAILERSKVSLVDRSQTGFLLARALWESSGDRKRARELAARARATVLEVGGDPEIVTEIDAWLAALE